MRKNGLILIDHLVLETGKYRKMESELSAHMQRCIHFFIEMEEEDVIYSVVKGVCIFFFLKLQKIPSVGEVAWILAYFQTGVWSSFLSLLLPGHPSCCQPAPQTESLPVGKGVPVAGLISSSVSLAGWMVPRGSASPFASLLCQPICLASSLHEEVIVCDNSVIYSLNIFNYHHPSSLALSF